MSKVLYIIMNDIHPGENHSGPTVRSLEILKEMNLLHSNLDVIRGKSPRERLEKFKALDSNNRYDFCYIELKVGVTRYYDTMLLLSLKRKFKNLKIGMYYRDMYWGYGIQVSKGYLKNLLVPIANKYHLKFLSNIADVMFGQSKSFCEEMKKFVSGDCELKIISPGCENINVPKENPSGVIYVGEIDEVFSGVELLIESMFLVNQIKHVPLYLVCRKHEYDQSLLLQKANEKYEWLNIEHHTKETIGSVYSKASLAIIPRYKNDYTKLCLPIKLFEYITYELPIIAVRHGEVSNFIEDHNIGYVTPPDANEISENVLKLIEESMLNQKMIENLKSAKRKNSWNQRVHQITKVLSS
ncbi:glycosyltransferase [Priestia aryabhattai]|uniref:glycosyltransferase n=1 Tax=Priestia megaterium TaxID=1404 RepID=UPI0039B959AB